MLSCCFSTSGGHRLRTARPASSAFHGRGPVRAPFGRKGGKVTLGPQGHPAQPYTALFPSMQPRSPPRGCMWEWGRGHVGWALPEEVQADEGSEPGGQVVVTPQVQAGWWDGVGGPALRPRADPGPAGMGRCVLGAGLCTPRSVCDLGAQGEWAGAQGGGPGGAVRPPGGCPSPSLQSTAEDVGRRLADTRSHLPPVVQLCPAAQQSQRGRRDKVSTEPSPGAGTQDCLERPLTSPRPQFLYLLHFTGGPRSQDLAQST